jgi:hypothetical protein
MAFAPPEAGLTFADLLAPTRQRLAAAALASALACVVAALGRRIAAPAGAALVALAAVAELLVAHQALNPTAPPALYLHRPELLDAAAPANGARIYAYDYFFSGRSAAHLDRAPCRVATPRWPSPRGAGPGHEAYLFHPRAGRGRGGQYVDVPGLGSPRRRSDRPAAGVEGTPLGGSSAWGGGPRRRPARGRLRRPRPLARWRAFSRSRFSFRRGRRAAANLRRGARVADRPARCVPLDPSFDPAHGGAVERRRVAAAPRSQGGAGSSRWTPTSDRQADLAAPGYTSLVDAWDPAAGVGGGPAVVRRANVASGP